MLYLAFLIIFPFIVAAVLTCMKRDSALRTAVVVTGAAAEIMAAVVFSVAHNIWAPPVSYAYLSHTENIDRLIAVCEVLLMVLVFSQAIRFRKYYILLLSALGTIPVLWLDMTGAGESTTAHIYVDTLTVIMVLMVGIVGSLICIYAV